MSEFHFFMVFHEFLTGFSHNRVCPHVPHATHTCFCRECPKTLMSSAQKRCNAPKQRKKWGNAHIHFGFLRIFTAFHTFLTGNSHICKKKRNVSAKKTLRQKQKNGFARNAREFISIRSLQKKKQKRRRKNAHPSWNSCIFTAFHTSFTGNFHIRFLQKKPSARKKFSKKNASAAKKRFRTHRAGKMPIHLGISHATHRTCTRL